MNEFVLFDFCNFLKMYLKIDLFSQQIIVNSSIVKVKSHPVDILD